LKISRPVFASIEMRCVSIALNRETFVVAAAAYARFAGSIGIRPVYAAGSRVERDDFVRGRRRLHGVHHAVDHQRRGFEFCRAVHCAHLQNPLQLEILHVVRCDLTQQAVALIEKRAAIGQPVLRFFVGVENPFERDLLGGDGRRRGE
jgi:hypothetical protein